MSIFSEFNERFSGRFFGKYRGFVTRVEDDPKNMGRIMVKVPVILGNDSELGWALPSPAFGGSRNTGLVLLPAKGDFVWIEFEEGDPERPIWSPGPWPLANGQSFMPKHAQGKADATDYAMRDMGNIPPTQFTASYGKVFTLQSHDGSFLELDGSDNHRVQLSHTSGTRVEMTSDGSLQEVVAGMARKRSASDTSLEIGGNNSTYVCGGENKVVHGQVTETFYKGMSQLFGFRLNQLPGLDEDSMSSSEKEKLYDLNGDAIYMPADLKQKGGAYTGIWDNSVSYRCGGSFSVRAGGNLQLTCGGKFSIMGMTSASITASDNLEFVAQNAVYGDIGAAITPLKACTFYGYNGISEFVSFDITGVASHAGILADPGAAVRGRVNPILTLLAGMGPIAASVGGQIQLIGLPFPSPNIKLGGSLAVFSVAVAETLKIFLDTVMPMLTAHTHPFPTGPSPDFVGYWQAGSALWETLGVSSKTVKVSP